MDGKFIAYYRVSTKRQDLGLDAQRRAVESFLNGGRWELLAEFTERESGKDDRNRPELQKAMTLAKAHGAKLVIAKLDRLSREVHFLSGLEKRGVDFVCADMPTADKTTIGFMSVMAQRERELISQRTKDGLASIKAKLAAGETHVSRASGHLVTALGNPRGMPAARRASGVQAIKANADAFAATILPLITDAKAAGKTLKTIAEGLNAAGMQTRRGKQWTPVAVKRVLERDV